MAWVETWNLAASREPLTGLVALLALAILSLVAVVGLTRPVRREPASARSAPEPAAAAPVTGDAGSLDSLLDAIHVEHLLNHGR